MIHCNGAEVINTLVNTETCKMDASGPNYWRGVATKISFGFEDTASDFYSSPHGSFDSSDCTSSLN